MSTALNNDGHNCNIATQAESLVMAKERIVEQYGEIRYTIGTGCSGGSLTQQQVANAYPGIYQGILPQCSYPDALSHRRAVRRLPPAPHLLRGPVEVGVSASLWTPAQWPPSRAISSSQRDRGRRGSLQVATSPDGAPASRRTRLPRGDEPGRRALLDPRLHDQRLRPAAEEPSGRRMEQAVGRGFGAFPVGNVGVQYGLERAESGLITTGPVRGPEREDRRPRHRHQPGAGAHRRRSRRHWRTPTAAARSTRRTTSTRSRSSTSAGPIRASPTTRYRSWEMRRGSTASTATTTTT